MWPFDKLRRKTTHPSLKRAEAYFKYFDTNRPVEEYEFTVLDSELTGLDRRSDEIVSIAALRIRNLQIVMDECIHSHLRTRKQTVTSGTFIHRITPQQSKNAPEPEMVMPAFSEFCGATVLVGHCLDIDLPFLNKAGESTLGGKFPHLYLDTMELSRALSKKDKSSRCGDPKNDRRLDLNTLSRSYDLPKFHQHDALEDAMQTAYLFLFLVSRLRCAGLRTLSDFAEARSMGVEIVMPAY